MRTPTACPPHMPFSGWLTIHIGQPGSLGKQALSWVISQVGIEQKPTVLFSSLEICGAMLSLALRLVHAGTAVGPTPEHWRERVTTESSFFKTQCPGRLMLWGKGPGARRTELRQVPELSEVLKFWGYSFPE